MTVYPVLGGGYGCNAYILTEDGRCAVLIDCSEQAYATVKKLNLKAEAVLLTHGHFDHLGGCDLFCGDGVPVYCGEDEKQYIFSDENRGIFGGVRIPEFSVYKTLSDGESITLAGMKFTVLSTAGHTAGSVCYICGNALFSGDTLFRSGVGRCDLAGGNYKTLLTSLKKIFSLGKNYEIYCGHGEKTTLEREKLHNPYAKLC